MASNDIPLPSRNLTILISGNGSNLQALIDACPSSPSHASTTSTTTNSDSGRPGLPPNTRITHVISDRKDAYGLQRARQAGIPTTYHGILPYKKKYPDSDGSGEFAEARKAYDARLAELVLEGPAASTSQSSSSESKDPAQSTSEAASSQSQSQPQPQPTPETIRKPDLVICAGFMRILTPSFLLPLHESPGLKIINLHPSLHGDLIGANCIERAWREFQEGKRIKTGCMIHYVIAEVDMGGLIVQTEVDIRGCETLGGLEGRVHEREHGLIVEGAAMVLEGRG